MRWISVKDRLPDAAGYECLVCAINENYNQMHVFTAHTGYGEPGWWTSNVHYMARVLSPSDNKLHPALKVTHWMPLPEPPEDMTRVCKVCGKQFVGRRKNNTLCDVCGSPAMKNRRTRAKKKMGAVNDAP